MRRAGVPSAGTEDLLSWAVGSTELRAYDLREQRVLQTICVQKLMIYFVVEVKRRFLRTSRWL